jgi:hypothetical protein
MDPWRRIVRLSFAYGPMFARRRGLVIAPGLLHVAGMAKQAPLPKQRHYRNPAWNRAVRHRELPGCREHGLQRRIEILSESEVDHGKLSRLIPSAAGERHQTVLPQIGNLDYRRCVSLLICNQ